MDEYEYGFLRSLISNSRTSSSSSRLVQIQMPLLLFFFLVLHSQTPEAVQRSDIGLKGGKNNKNVVLLVVVLDSMWRQECGKKLMRVRSPVYDTPALLWNSTLKCSTGQQHVGRCLETYWGRNSAPTKNLPYIFGNKEEFKILYLDLIKIEFPIEIIEKYPNLFLLQILIKLLINAMS